MQDAEQTGVRERCGGAPTLELLVGAIQAYVFALLTSLYINDAVHLH